MAMSELDKLKYAVSYLDKLIVGENPNTGEVLFDKDDRHNAGIVNCLSFVRTYLGDRIKEKEIVPRKFEMTEQARRSVQLFPEGVGITNFVEMINRNAKEPDMNRLRGRQVTAWLIDNGYLTFEVHGTKGFRVPTQKGRDLGIHTYEYTTEGIPYIMNIYNSNAQTFILDHIGDIVDNKKITEE